MDNINIGDLATEKLEEAFRMRGHANVLIAGRTGVGKSTLINSVFQGDLATVGQGRPVTENTREITREDIPLSIFDTRGLEMAEFTSTIEALESFIAERHRNTDQKKHIHVAWVCIAEDLRRVEMAETELTAMLSKYVPVIGVVTKARSDNGFRAEVQRLLPLTRNVLRVRAIKETLDDGYSIPSMGLSDLVRSTVDLFPEGQKMAFAAAQKADLDLKRQRSQKIVVQAASAAAGIGATPIPFADAALLVPTQVSMLARISSAYGLSFSSGSLSTMVAGMAGGAVATLTGRLIVGSLLKLIPGVGTIGGGVIAAGTAAAMTTALGGTYISILDALFTKYAGEPPSEDEVVEEVKRRFGKKPPSGRKDIGLPAE